MYQREINGGLLSVKIKLTTYNILRMKWIICHECELFVKFVKVIKDLHRLTAQLLAFNASKFNLLEFCKLCVNFK